MNVEKSNTQFVHIEVDKSKGIVIKTSNSTLPDVIRLCLTAMEALCKQTLDRAPDDLKLALEEDMYEQINIGASALLDRAFPNVTARPDLTVDAILEAENKLFMEKGQDYVDAYNSSAQAVKDAEDAKEIKEAIKKSRKKKNA